MNRNKRNVIFIIIGLIILIAGASIFYNSQTKEETNQNPNEYIPAIDFNVQNQNGTNTFLSDFKDGKLIVINFWSSQCGPCVQEMPDFQRLYDDYKDKVHFVMIDSIGALGETKEMGKNFISQNGYSFPVYYDVNKNAQQEYGVRSFPTTYLINEDFEITKGGAGMINYTILSEAIEEELNN